MSGNVEIVNKTEISEELKKIITNFMKNIIEE